VMEDVDGMPDQTVNATDTVEQVMRAITDQDAPFAVMDEGQVIGQVSRASVLRGLLDPRKVDS